MDKLKKYFGDWNFYKSTLLLILPILAQQLFLSIAGYVDNLMVNSYGVGGIAYNGVSAANRLMFIINGTELGFACAASIFISQFFGAKNNRKMNESLMFTLYIAFVLGIIGLLVIHFFGNSIVDAYLVGEESRQFGYDYLRAIKWGSPIVAVIMAYANCLRATKRTTLPLVSSIIGTIVNIILNYALIFGHFGFAEMGTYGAAVATVISRIVEFLIMFFYCGFAKNSPFKKYWTEWKISRFIMRSFKKRCVFLTFNEFLWTIGLSLTVLFYTWKNDLWYNAYAYSQNVSDLFFIVFAGLGNGTAIIVGTSLGAGNLEQAKTDANRMKMFSILISVFTGVLMWIFAPFILDLFSPSPESKVIAINILRVTAVFIAVYAYNATCFFILRSGGDSIRAFLLDQGATYVIGLPICAILGINAASLGIDVVIVFLAAHTCDVIKIFVATSFVKKGKWLNNLTIDHDEDVI